MSISTSVNPSLADGPFCSIQRALELVGERWTFLILREAIIARETRFAGFQKILGIAPNILTDRLNSLVAAGIFEKREYKEPGSRARASYHLTPEGESLKFVLLAIQQWGDDHVPHPAGPSLLRVTTGDRRPVRMVFADDSGEQRDVSEIEWETTDSYPAAMRAARLAG
jgi:DNA-binding HxlR family transcriptional regulator